MKPFDLELAKAGYPVCTKDGRDARIICFDKKDKYYPIVAIITDTDMREYCYTFAINGRNEHNEQSDKDLIMKSTKKEGWINVFRSSGQYVG